ncbi:MAG: hypothetical protein HGA44_05445, partial [Cellulomonadaceae bacterium]|nr:hypothetical protein [Cellulomonadaceae bacterium]
MSQERQDPTTGPVEQFDSETEQTMNPDQTPTSILPVSDTPEPDDLVVDGPSLSAAPTTGSTAAGGAAPTTATVEPPRAGVRVGTVVWGLVIAAVGLGLIALASGVTFDVQLAVIVL